MTHVTKQEVGNFLKEHLPTTKSSPSSAKADAASMEFYTAINGFLAQCDIAPITPQFIDNAQAMQLRDFFYRYNESTNPLSQAAQSDELGYNWFCENMAKLTTQADRFFEAKSLTISSGKTELPPAQEGEDKIQLQKRTLMKNADGTITAHYEQADHIDTTRPFIIGMSGVGQIHDSTKLSRGFLKHMARTLGGEEYCLEKEIDCYTITLPRAHRTRYHADTYAYNAAPNTHISAPIQQFVDEYILPALQLDGEKLSDTALAEQLHKLNFFAYSYGSICAKEIRNALTNHLQTQGYSDQAITYGLAQAYALNIGPTADFTRAAPLGDFSSVYVASPNDHMARSKIDIRDYLLEENNSVPIGANGLFIRSQAMPNAYLLDASENTLPTKWDELRSSANDNGHGLRSYSQKSAVIHDPSYIGSFLRYALQGKEGALDTQTPDDTIKEIASQSAAATLPGKHVITALMRSAEQALLPYRQ